MPPMNVVSVPTAATATTQRQRGPGSRPSGNSSSATGRQNVMAGAQVASANVASVRQNRPAARSGAFSSIVVA